MAPSGRFVALRRPGAIEVVDVLGVSPRRTYVLDGGDFAIAGSRLCLLDRGGLRVEALEGSAPRGDLAVAPGALRTFWGRASDAVLVGGVIVGLAPVAIVGAVEPGACFPLLGRAVAQVGGAGSGTRISIVTPGRPALLEMALPGGSEALAVAPVFGGRLLALHVRDAEGEAILVLTATGRLVHRLRIAAVRWHAFAIERGLLLLGTDEQDVLCIDLRYGRTIGHGAAPHAITELVVDDDGRNAAIAGPSSGDVPIISLLRVDELLRPTATVAVAARGAEPPVVPDTGLGVDLDPGRDAGVAVDARADVELPSDASRADRQAHAEPHARAAREAPAARGSAADLGLAPADPALRAALEAGVAAAQAIPEPRLFDDSSSRTACVIELVEDIPTGHAAPLTLEVSTILDAPDAADDAVPQLAPRAFGAPFVRAEIAETSEAPPFADAAEHLTALLDLVAARAALAIAESWHSGRISGDGIDHHPFELEVRALSGTGTGLAADQLAEARRRLAAQADAVTARVIASLGVDLELPFIELSRELGLSGIATQLLVAALAPRARGEIGRLYRILANEQGRPTCDDALLATLLAGDDARMRDQLCAELGDAGVLLRHGLIVRDPRGGLDVDDALLARLRGQPAPRSSATVVRAADRALDDLVIDRGALGTLVRELAAPRDPDQPVRVVIRGRRGSGRHATIAALAARVDRAIACIDASQLPHGPLRAAALRRELARAVIGRAIPVLSGLEVRESADPETTMLVAQVLHAHPGPLVVRTAEDAAVPLQPGYVDVVLAPLSETERQRAFAVELDRHAIAGNAELLAARHRIGPGTIARVAAEARRRLDRGAADPTAIVDAVIRQHVAARVGHAATRVTRLATWDQVSLPEDMLDSLRELIGRARHGRTVFDDWGYDHRIATARGLTALFYGPPGTGKTLVASLIARELGLELYRVDLAKVMSKWVGETEKNLGEVFDAAEDGRLMLLFDEADSLFAKRSEVKSSNDRYANLEVNYLLQRLDAFEGVAILTTNLEGSIDPAFKRRLSMRLYFPFPDEELRAQLWAAHITPQVPTAGRLDFAALARRFPLSGGYIRNSALRAAFLAAQEKSALTQAHLERAVLLEYRELGKLADDGRLD